MKKPFIIGVAGGSGSGKTYILHQLSQRLGHQKAAVVSQDNYYRPIHEQTRDKNGIENFDLPDAINWEAFVSDVKQLANGETITRTEYTFNNQSKEPRTVIIQPTPIIIVEGIFVFHHDIIQSLLDYKIFISCSKEIMVNRRVKRDAISRGYDLNDVMYRFENHVWPAYEKYILPYQNQAEWSIDNSLDNQTIDWRNLDKTLKEYYQTES